MSEDNKNSVNFDLEKEVESNEDDLDLSNLSPDEILGEIYKSDPILGQLFSAFTTLAVRIKDLEAKLDEVNKSHAATMFLVENVYANNPELKAKLEEFKNVDLDA